MLHVRIVAPEDRSSRVVDLLKADESVTNVIFFPGAAKDPVGDVILADVAREDASVILSDLKELDLEEHGSIALDEVDAHVSRRGDAAEAHARGAPSDAVVWEEVEARTSESTELSASFMAFMVVSGLLAACGIYLDSAVLLIGGMVVGPEFGPIAGLCVALTTRRSDMAWRSFVPLALGLPAVTLSVLLLFLVFKATGLTSGTFTEDDHGLADVISSPDFFSFFVAGCAGVAGMLSLSTAKSGALIGVLISVTTLPAAANVGITVAYGEWDTALGSAAQLGLNLVAIMVAGTATLWIQRVLYVRRRRRHLRDPERRAAGLPVGRSRRSSSRAPG